MIGLTPLRADVGQGAARQHRGPAGVCRVARLHLAQVVQEQPRIVLPIVHHAQLPGRQQDHFPPPAVPPMRFQHGAALLRLGAGQVVAREVLLEGQVEEAVLPQPALAQQTGLAACEGEQPIGDGLRPGPVVALIFRQDGQQTVMAFLKRRCAAGPLLMQPEGQIGDQPA